MSEQESESTVPKQPPIPESVDTARKITPIRVMRRGEDSFDADNEVVFADFSPKVLPADYPDEEVTVPKDAFAPAPVPSGDLAPASAQTSSGTSVPKSVTSGAGKPSPSATSSPASSSPKKSG